MAVPCHPLPPANHSIATRRREDSKTADPQRPRIGTIAPGLTRRWSVVEDRDMTPAAPANTNAAALSAEQRHNWERDGFTIIRDFASADTLEAMLARIRELARQADDGEQIGDAYVVPEASLAAAVLRRARVGEAVTEGPSHPRLDGCGVRGLLLRGAGPVLPRASFRLGPCQRR